jgi:type II secretion system protein G
LFRESNFSLNFKFKEKRGFSPLFFDQSGSPEAIELWTKAPSSKTISVMKKIILAMACLLLGGLMAFLFHGPTSPQQAVNGTESSLSLLGQALSAYKTDCGQFPPQENWVQALSTKNHCQGEHGPYLQVIPKDAWGRDFYYHPQTAGVEVGSFGEDGQAGGSGAASDIKIWVD